MGLRAAQRTHKKRERSGQSGQAELATHTSRSLPHPSGIHCRHTCKDAAPPSGGVASDSASARRTAKSIGGDEEDGSEKH